MKFFLAIGMADRSTQMRMRGHIASLPDAAAFIEFAKRTLTVLAETKADGEFSNTDSGADFMKIRIRTRSHTGMKATSLCEKLRGFRGIRDGRKLGTPFQEKCDDGSWIPVLTKTPSFSKCVRYEILLFLEEFDIVNQPVFAKPNLAEVIPRLKSFFNRDFFEAVLPLRYISCEKVPPP